MCRMHHKPEYEYETGRWVHAVDGISMGTKSLGCLHDTGIIRTEGFLTAGVLGADVMSIGVQDDSESIIKAFNCIYTAS